MPTTTYGKGLRALAIATVVTMAAALVLVFFYAPDDAVQGFVQKIFYIHVPLAIISLCGFMFGGGLAIGYLRTGDRRWDMRSYVWNEPTLVSFLIVLLLFATYQPLRFSIEDPERQSRYASVFAIVAGAFVPLNYIAVQLATAYVHPRVLTLGGANLPPSMGLTFVVALIAITLLYVTLWKYEMASKNARAQVRRLRRTLLGDDLGRPVGRSAAPL